MRIRGAARLGTLLALMVAAVLDLSGCSGDGLDRGSGTTARNGRGVAGHAAQEPEITREQLVGLDAGAVERILGPADFRRNDGPVEIWQYRSADCALDLYLYADAASDWRVEHAAGRDLGGTSPTDGACVADLLRERQRAAG